MCFARPRRVGGGGISILSSKRMLRCAPSERSAEVREASHLVLEANAPLRFERTHHRSEPSLRSARLRGRDGEYAACQDLWLWFPGGCRFCELAVNRQIYSWYEQSGCLDQSRARIRFVVYGYGYDCTADRWRHSKRSVIFSRIACGWRKGDVHEVGEEEEVSRCMNPSSERQERLLL
jgi:hypothetical protein